MSHLLTANHIDVVYKVYTEHTGWFTLQLVHSCHTDVKKLIICNLYVLSTNIADT